LPFSLFSCSVSLPPHSLASSNRCSRANTPDDNNGNDLQVLTTGEHRPILVCLNLFVKRDTTNYSLVTSSMLCVPLPRYPCMRRQSHTMPLSERRGHQVFDSRRSRQNCWYGHLCEGWRLRRCRLSHERLVIVVSFVSVSDIRCLCWTAPQSRILCCSRSTLLSLHLFINHIKTLSQ
jgi:hypothetical protein